MEIGNPQSNHEASSNWLHRFDESLSGFVDEQVEIRRHLHRNPEPSGQEIETTKYIVSQLEKAGVKYRVCRSDKDVKTGVYADLELGSPDPKSPCIALRCDIDALRLTDMKTVEYRSQNQGITHACGHDAHTAIVLAAGLNASKLTDLPPEHSMRIRLIFQPSEESDGGATWMIDAGAMDGVNAILGVHVDPERQCGRVGIRYGVLTANCDEFEICVDGRGGHAARPHQAIDPVAASVRLVSSLYEIVPRRVDARLPSVLTVSRIQGGSASNVIPDRVEISGTLRTTNQDVREAIKTEMDRLCSATEISTGVQIRRRFINPVPAVVNDTKCAAALERASREVLGVEHLESITLPSMGGEDFSEYLAYAPGAMLRLGCGFADRENPYLHSPHFDIDERTLHLGSRLLMRAAIYLGHTYASK
ncbi:amidohydrolase [Thalassoroseus pseudoceratinae]|uniref:amidohydrolase n=1 Tax=Thalassoroseus pseudoceratinae TaxID=2713176 RepID=UPI001423C70D|nr:amidohydrolase [Thalassoroseus pseudoceratinae]